MNSIKEMKGRGEKITMLTGYDAWSARLLSKSSVDLILVGDSVAMVVHGHESTLHADIPMMELHTRAVCRGLEASKPVITDFPFLEFRKSREVIVETSRRLMVAGANALKVEGAKGNLEKIGFLVESGVPIVGHLGLMPQMINTLGGYRVQGKQEEDFQDILRDAKALEQAGCCALVLECVPSRLATTITEELSVPVIGIGAGQGVDGQVLVLHDLLGVNSAFQPKFVRRYDHLEDSVVAAINEYVKDVKSETFPTARESYI